MSQRRAAGISFRHLVWAGLALGLVVALATIRHTHRRVLPNMVCTTCHGTGILQANVMRTAGDRYIGSDACEPCHTTIYHTWSRSTHCRTMMCADPTAIVGDFSPSGVTYEYQGKVTKMVRGPEGFSMVVPEPDGTPVSYTIETTVGIRDQQAYLTKFPDGRYQILPTAWDIRRQTWFDASEGIVLPQHAERSRGAYDWKNIGRTWNAQCDCHLSGLERNYDPVSNTYASTWRSLDIDCESCHGPGQAHTRLRTIKRLRPRVADDTSLVSYEKLSPRVQVEICAQCHAHRDVVAAGYDAGDEFTEFFDMALLDHDMVMPDGRYAALMYEVLGLMQSPCFTHGGITCMHCHDAHGSGLKNDLRPFSHPNDMCRPCHVRIVEDPRAHTFHRPDSTGNDCRACHMQALDGARLKLPDHSLSLPVPENTALFGSPNPCTSCHMDSTTAWAVATLDRWYGKDRRDRWTRAAVVWKAKQLDRAAVEPLIAMLADTAVNFIWRASAARFLGDLGDERAVPALLAALQEPEPMIRMRAVSALTDIPDPRIEPAVRPLLMAEKNSQIRLAMAAMLGYWWRSDVPPRDRAIANATWEQFVRQVNTAQSDHPRAHRQLGDLYLKRGQYRSAEQEFQVSLRLMPNNPVALSGLGETYHLMGRYDEAAAFYRRAVELEPNDAGYRANLGVTLANLGRLDGAEEEFRAALASDPDLAPASLNLARLLMGRGDVRGAHRMAKQAVGRDSSMVESQYLLGILALRLDRRDEAVQALVNVLALAPDAPFSASVREELSRLAVLGSRLPAPMVGWHDPPRPEGPQRPVDPHAVWPMYSWPDHTLRTTPEDVAALPAPSSLGATLDSARAWLAWSESPRLPAGPRRAYAERAVEVLNPYLASPPEDRAEAFEARRLAGHAYAVLSSTSAAGKRDSIATLAAEVLAEIDTTAIRDVPGASVRLGRAHYRLARSYNEQKAWDKAVPQFALAARLVPNTFTEAISYFFMGTSYDRLDEREKAVEMYRRSETAPHNSQRGYRCARHAQVYQFAYVP